jgi:tripartite-type tricarboxylate transporter receptor subunit TctC
VTDVQCTSANDSLDPMKMTMKFWDAGRCWRRTVGAAAAICLAFACQAQTSNARAITLWVPWSAGGLSDQVARRMATEMAALLGQPVIVENAPGAGGSLGVSKALAAPPDGHAVIVSSPLDAILAPMTFPSATYQAEELRTVALLVRTDLMLVTRKDLGVSGLTQLLELARSAAAQPLTYCALGGGSLQSLVSHQFAALAGLSLQAIPYSGLPPCVHDLMGGRVDMAFVPVGGPFPGYVDDGRLKAMALLGDKAHPRLPNLPLARATPGMEGLNVSLWVGLHVHRKVADSEAMRLNQAAYAALAKSELRQAIESTGATVLPSSSLEEAQARYLLDVARLKAMASAAGRTKP